ncbi:MAG: DNA polymerase [Proteobacteria bacterium]|nr:DNA polymerase [Pseudomonadota bacterium]NBP15757.1 DNA polymerase [bacterium]
MENFPIFGNTNYAYQYITKTFPQEVEFDISSIKIYSIDIETSAEFGFPDVNNPSEEILLITIQDYNTKDITTFGVKPFVVSKTNHNYVRCKDEYDLLKKFIEFISSDYPHIITGWNIEFFDIPYLCNRIKKVLGEDSMKELSPWNVVNQREISRFKNTETVFDILGVSILDYLDLYKKFTYTAQESYKLDHIAKIELGKEKLDYGEFDSFRMFYKNNWQKFVEYNVVDTELVDQLEDKMKLIELILTMAYDAKCNYVDVFSAVRTWDCILWNHLWKKNIVVHQRDESRRGRQIEGAFVQEPVPGKYDWVVSFDATSLYPSIIMQYNMSPETIMPQGIDVSVNGLLKKDYLLDTLKEDNLCMAANGYSFKTDKQGIFPEIVQKLFDDRQKYKKLMIAAQKKYEETKDKQYQKDIARYNNFQMARKIQLNSLFGAWGNEFFRFYDDRIAEGITITGQYIIRTVGKALDGYLNKVCNTNDFTYSFYSDTDACYITLDNLVKKFYNDVPPEKLVNILDIICSEKIEKVINKACDDLMSYTNAFERKVYFKREVIAERGIWVAKKRYALNVYNNEGVQYAEPKLKVMGLEIVRSSTPEPIREGLREAVKIALTKTELHLQKFVREFEEKFRELQPEDIAFPRSVNGVIKYNDRSSIYKQGTPMHVRGALLYNFYLSKEKLDKKYEMIREGDKIKFLYLKEPNPIGENCIAFVSSIPEELNLKKYADYDTMFSKSFLEPMTTILNGIGWSAKPKASLEGLFS